MDVNDQVNEEWKQLLVVMAEKKDFSPLFAFLEVHIPSRPHQVSEWIKDLEKIVNQNPDPLTENHLKTIRGYSLIMLSELEEAASMLQEALSTYETLGDEFGISRAAGGLASVYISLGNFGKAMSYGNKSLELHEKLGDLVMKGWGLHGFGTGFENVNDLNKALEYYEESLSLFTEIEHNVGIARALTGIGSVYQKEGRFEEALPIQQESLKIFNKMNNEIGISRALNDIGTTYFHLGAFEKAEAFLLQSLQKREAIGNRQAQSTSLLELGRLKIKSNNLEDARILLEKGLAIARDVKAKVRIYELNYELYLVFNALGDAEKALHHFVDFHEVYREVFSDKMQAKLDQMRVSQAVEQAEERVAMMKQKNEALNEKNEELEKLLIELKTTQERLIQQQKLASLGQMTAGIAHEIKNPLNFVNNFALMSEELVEELDSVLRGNEADEMVDVDTLLEDLRFNARKINEHGKRANSIVQNMMLLAREGPRNFTPVDINDLVKEALNLAYHGYRSENEGFSCQQDLILDAEISPVPLIRQEIERVLINLFNNAFYAVQNRSTFESETHTPEVQVLSKNESDFIRIEVMDNGVGIPSEVEGKIFDPFYTTKPAGKGTGLGLSMSHEIIVQGHQGTLQYNKTKKGLSRFVIRIPKNLPIQEES